MGKYVYTIEWTWDNGKVDAEETFTTKAAAREAIKNDREEYAHFHFGGTTVGYRLYRTPVIESELIEEVTYK